MIVPEMVAPRDRNFSLGSVGENWRSSPFPAFFGEGDRTLAEVKIESVSIGKGFVQWRVILPALQRRPRTLKREYAQLQDACTAVKKNFAREEVTTETATLVEEHDPHTSWGSARQY